MSLFEKTHILPVETVVFILLSRADLYHLKEQNKIPTVVKTRQSIRIDNVTLDRFLGQHVRGRITKKRLAAAFKFKKEEKNECIA